MKGAPDAERLREEEGQEDKAPLSDDEQFVAQTIEALHHLAAIIKEAPVGMGGGTSTCPRCAGVLRYNFEKRQRGSRRTSYLAWCETPSCIRFSGH